MHISKLSLVNYRNFANAKLVFKEGVNTIIGENGSGKTNVFRAIRLLLDDNLLRFAYKLDERDFFRGLSDWRGHWIIISLEFEKISQDEAIQSLFLHGAGNVLEGAVSRATYNLIFRPKHEYRLAMSKLAEGDHAGLDALRKTMTIDAYEVIFTGKSEADFNDEATYKTIVGDFEEVKFNKELTLPVIGSKIPGILSVSKEISFTFVQALRDVIAEFQNNRTNPLLTLLKSKSGEIDPLVFQPIADLVNGLNTSIEKLDDVQEIRSDITNTIKDAAGETYSPTSLSIKSDLSDKADKLFQSLKLFVGESETGHEGPIHELSLGGANLIYLTLRLLEFKYQKAKQSFANFLLIEEPEAHIHTHIQKTLFDRLNFEDTQIIYSTHSTHISEVSNVEKINILSKHQNMCEAYQPSVGMSPTDIRNVQRYLDAVRSNLLFAKSVVLIEGDAEEILIPVMIKNVFGVSLDELGISLINIRSTGFKNVASLFHDLRIRKKCSIITDLDAAIIDTTPGPADDKNLKTFKEKCLASQKSGSERKATLEAFEQGNRWIKTFFADHTFEVDFIKNGNASQVLAIIPDVYSAETSITQAQIDMTSGNITQYGRRVLRMAAQEGKGWFAILLSKKIHHQTVIPDYILNAIFFSYPNISNKVWVNILSYRLKCIQGVADPSPDVVDFRTKLRAFKTGALTFEEIRNAMLATFPTDKINDIMGKF
jgi:putative ATP-dependent endonuclease of the OLD family